MALLYKHGAAWFLHMCRMICKNYQCQWPCRPSANIPGVYGDCMVQTYGRIRRVRGTREAGEVTEEPVSLVCLPRLYVWSGKPTLGECVSVWLIKVC